MESRAFSIYEHRVITRKKAFAWALLLTLATTAVLPARAAGNEYFLILSDKGNSVDAAAEIVRLGGDILLQAPPRVVSATLPPGLAPTQLAHVQNSFSGVVPLAAVKSLGPVAISAARDWNRGVAGREKQAGKSAFKAAAAEIKAAFLELPEALKTNLAGNLLQVEWQPVYGASLYQVQAALEQTFAKTIHQTFSETPAVKIPMPASSNSPLFIRVRAIEKLRVSSNFEDIPGGWSQVEVKDALPELPAEILPAPQAASPVNGYETEGFSVTLEWASPYSTAQRIQLADSAAFSNVLVDEAVSVKAWSAPSGIFQLGKTYFWRVKEWDSGQSSPWSENKNFKVTEPRQIDGDMMVNPEAPR